MASRNREAAKDGEPYKQMPVHALLIWKATIEEYTGEASTRLRQASVEEAARRGTTHLEHWLLQFVESHA